MSFWKHQKKNKEQRKVVIWKVIIWFLIVKLFNYLILQVSSLATMGENWDEAPAPVAEPLPAVTVEYDEVKLFGKWSCDEVQVSDISLTVSGHWLFNIVFIMAKTNHSQAGSLML